MLPRSIDAPDIFIRFLRDLCDCCISAHSLDLHEMLSRFYYCTYIDRPEHCYVFHLEIAKSRSVDCDHHNTDQWSITQHWHVDMPLDGRTLYSSLQLAHLSTMLLLSMNRWQRPEPCYCAKCSKTLQGFTHQTGQQQWKHLKKYGPALSIMCQLSWRRSWTSATGSGVLSHCSSL